jgi:hypothetical protein
MAFRRPEENRSSPPLGYRLSSNRQPGVEIANNRMPQQSMNPRFFDRSINQNISAPDLNNPGLRRHIFQNMGRSNMNPPLKKPESFTNLDMIGRPDAAFRYSHMEPDRMSYDLFDTPGNPSQDASIRGTYRITEDARPRNKLYDEYGYLEGAPRQRTTFSEGYMGPRSFDEMYGGVYDDAIFRTVDPNTNQIEQFPMAEGIEQAALDPSDYRTIMKILEAGGNPEDYMAANRGGIASLMR